MIQQQSPVDSSKDATLRIMVDMSATLLHHGHVRLLKRAKEFGHVVVALTTDDEIESHKGYKPELDFDQRKELLLALRYVDEVVPSKWMLDDAYVRQHNIDMLIHGDDNCNTFEHIRTFARTADISSQLMRERALTSLVMLDNSKKCLLTPGPTNLHPDSIKGLKPVFTRGDDEYSTIEGYVLDKVRARAGQDSIACLQGSATTAIEVASTNFLYGKVLVIHSGYYSERILHILERKRKTMNLEVMSMTYPEFINESKSLASSRLDWIVAVSTETADAFLGDIKLMKAVCEKSGAKLMLDATGSINLEADHELADICMFSSCKGLGGLTGAGFITYNKELLSNLNRSPKEFILDIDTYIQKKTTGPAHTLLSLHLIADRFEQLGVRVRESKRIFVEKYRQFLFRADNQPALCTKFRADFVNLPTGTISYKPRSIEPGSHVICHLFDQFESNRTVGDFYDAIEIR